MKSLQPSLIALLVSTALLAGCQPAADKPATTTPVAAAAAAPTAEQAKAFLQQAATDLDALIIESGRAEWIANNFITEDTEALAASVNEKLTAKIVKMANEAARFNQVQVDADTRRQLELLKQALTLAAPTDSAKTAELAGLPAQLNGI